MNKLLAYLNSPTSRTGEAMIAGAAVSFFSGMPWQHAVGVALAGVVLVAIPDNSVMQKDLDALIADGVTAAMDAQKGVSK